MANRVECYFVAVCDRCNVAGRYSGTRNADAVARFRAEGWIIGSKNTLCPWCSGKKNKPAKVKEVIGNE